MIEIGKALVYYHEQHQKFPDSLDALSGIFPNGFPEDPYTKKRYDYRITKDGLVLTCLGKDRARGGEERHDKDIIVTQEGLVSDD